MALQQFKSEAHMYFPVTENAVELSTNISEKQRWEVVLRKAPDYNTCVMTILKHT